MNAKYHKGELELQQRFGETTMAKRVGRIISNKIIPGAIPFIENQPFAILSSTDSNDDNWCSILIGEDGWISATEEGKIHFDLDKIYSPKTDLFFNNIIESHQVGMIVIDLSTRRRYRINGRVLLNNSHLELTIEEAYPNCPKYIQRRISNFNNQDNTQPTISKGNSLDEKQKRWITQSDTFFVGSQSSSGFLDVNHRGGNPGFIEILENGDLKIPDYVGNNMYNTLGNFVENPKAGLLFFDFDKGSILQLTGSTSFLFDQFSDLDNAKTMETGRYWLFTPEKWIQTDQYHNINWELLDNSPFNP
ncbi:PNPOx family protein [Tenacibaculum agarivorans]|uniref:pyridoxamine 5'-phosphate oxidase family protein n=1 Tax=Tenacibaculum agarivorans TaxID=1908389 RepID=UPI0009FB7D3B|nr:pyridoxamine 5'-phosphate oxidase family protein [Tenacibaculum agarivorans]